MALQKTTGLKNGLLLTVMAAVLGMLALFSCHRNSEVALRKALSNTQLIIDHLSVESVYIDDPQTTRWEAPRLKIEFDEIPNIVVRQPQPLNDSTVHEDVVVLLNVNDPPDTAAISIKIDSAEYYSRQLCDDLIRIEKGPLRDPAILQSSGSRKIDSFDAEIHEIVVFDREQICLMDTSLDRRTLVCFSNQGKRVLAFRTGRQIDVYELPCDN